MKILHIINKLSTGGAQSLVAELAIGQMMNGDEVSILELMPSPDDILKEKSYSRWGCNAYPTSNRQCL